MKEILKIQYDLLAPYLFQVDFNSPILSQKEKDMLTNQVVSVAESCGALMITFNKNIVGQSIQPNAILEKLNESIIQDLTIKVKFVNREGEVIRLIKYKNCTFAPLSAEYHLDYGGVETTQLTFNLHIYYRKKKIKNGQL